MGSTGTAPGSPLSPSLSRARDLYLTGTGVRPTAFNEATARAYLGEYVAFVTESARAGGRVLDVGCGAGWSSRFLSDNGFDVCGLDLSIDQLEVKPSDRLRFVPGDAADLPFGTGELDVVCAYQTLEHVPDPGRVLAEFDRVLRPGGVVCVVGPNLISLLVSARAAAYYVWRNRPVRSIFLRQPGMQRHPGGNTFPEAVAGLLANGGRLVAKLASKEPAFSMRAPDTTTPFNSDNDACYLCNPIDLDRYFTRRHYEVLHRGKPGRPKVTWLLAGGTWFSARKPG
jgi:SAM-dependent methyltransferase